MADLPLSDFQIPKSLLSIQHLNFRFAEVYRPDLLKKERTHSAADFAVIAEFDAL
jgi:hypothetical protein